MQNIQHDVIQGCKVLLTAIDSVDTITLAIDAIGLAVAILRGGAHGHTMCMGPSDLRMRGQSSGQNEVRYLVEKAAENDCHV